VLDFIDLFTGHVPKLNPSVDMRYSRPNVAHTLAAEALLALDAQYILEDEYILALVAQ
jgi:hypothetical protein